MQAGLRHSVYELGVTNVGRVFAGSLCIELCECGKGFASASE